MKTAAMLLAAMMVASFSTTATAACRCTCVNGQIEAVCRSTTDLPPVCAPRACKAKSDQGSLFADQASAIGGGAKRQCRETLVRNPQTGAYVTKQVCQ
jgi:hypothetical protein